MTSKNRQLVFFFSIKFWLYPLYLCLFLPSTSSSLPSSSNWDSSWSRWCSRNFLALEIHQEWCQESCSVAPVSSTLFPRWAADRQIQGTALQLLFSFQPSAWPCSRFKLWGMEESTCWAGLCPRPLIGVLLFWPQGKKSCKQKLGVKNWK